MPIGIPSSPVLRRVGCHARAEHTHIPLRLTTSFTYLIYIFSRCRPSLKAARVTDPCEATGKRLARPALGHSSKFRQVSQRPCAISRFDVQADRLEDDVLWQCSGEASGRQRRCRVQHESDRVCRASGIRLSSCSCPNGQQTHRPGGRRPSASHKIEQGGFCGTNGSHALLRQLVF